MRAAGARFVSLVMVAALGACTQESLWLGALTWDAGAEGRRDGSVGPAADGSTSRDEQPDDEPMSVRLSARGRDGAIRISLSCGAECVEVRVKVAGGVPPYEVRWDDGETGAVRTLCADPRRSRGGVVQDASSGRNEPASFALAPVDYFSCDSPEYGYRVCFSPEAVASQCSQGADSGASFDLGKPIPAGARFEAEATVRGTVTSPYWSPALLTSSQDCADQMSLSGSSRDLDRDQHTMYLFANRLSYEVRYITVAQEDPFGGSLPPSTFDAGPPPEVESVVLCEYFAAPDTGADGGVSR